MANLDAGDPTLSSFYVRLAISPLRTVSSHQPAKHRDESTRVTITLSNLKVVFINPQQPRPASYADLEDCGP